MTTPSKTKTRSKTKQVKTKIKKHNKTIRFKNPIDKSKIIKDVNNKSLNQVDREKSIACYLANDNKVIQFASTVFYFILSYWKKHYPTKWKSIIQDEMLEDIEKKLIKKIGFSIEERNKVFEIFDNGNKIEFYAYLQDKFFKVTSTLNNFAKPIFIYYHVSVSKKLQDIFIRNLKSLFLIKTITWSEFTKTFSSVINKTKDNKDYINFCYFIFDIIIYGSKTTSQSLYNKNLSYLEFIRKNINEKDKNKVANLKHINVCNKSSVSDVQFKEYSIYNAQNVYKVDKKSPYGIIMQEYKEPYLSGPSGSTAILYINLFQMYNFQHTKKNIIMLLSMLVADYVPLWHTIPEILLSFNAEIQNIDIPHYKIEQDPVDYVVNIIKPYIYI